MPRALAAPTTIHSTEKKGSESLEPHKRSSIENEPSKHELSGLEIEIHRDGEKNITGHTVHHRMEPKMSKSGAFSEMPPKTSYTFDADGHSGTHGHIVDHMAEHMPHLFSSEHGMIEAENKPGTADDEEHDTYEA